MAQPIDAETRRKVFAQLRRCMENLVGGSGHLACYYLDEGSFELSPPRELGDGLFEWAFSVRGWLETEFTVHRSVEQGPAPDAAMQLSGAIVLDSRCQIVLDEEGRARLSPWRTLAPEHWS
jgi:hypothetical protein